MFLGQRSYFCFNGFLCCIVFLLVGFLWCLDRVFVGIHRIFHRQGV